LSTQYVDFFFLADGIEHLPMLSETLSSGCIC
jgi:hypothetical protein